jgi:hypothetical protein
MIRYAKPYIFSSSLNAEARNKTSDGSSFQVYLEQPILIPKEAVYCYLEVQSASIWNTSPNIKTGINDKLYVSDLSGDLTITIPQGLYDITLLNGEINRQILESGRPSDSVVFIGNTATQKTILQLLTIGTEIDFTQPQTIREIVGFDSVVIGASTVANELFDSQNIASFNQVNFFLVHGDIIQKGLKFNSKYQQILCDVAITAPAGSLVNYNPQNPPAIVSNLS